MTDYEKALEVFYKWNESTGAFEQDTGWFYEMQGIIRDAVKIGRVTAQGVFCYVQDGLLHVEPNHITEARKLIARLTSDIGFMGSPDYERASKLVMEYDAPFKKAKQEKAEREEYERLKEKFEHY